MCGRFAQNLTWKELHDLLANGRWPAGLFPFTSTGSNLEADQLAARYNIAPTQNAPVIRAVIEGEGSGAAVKGLEVCSLRWGLAPHWAADAKQGPINARAETVATNGVFRSAFASRRCVVPVSGFYEWKKTMVPQLIGEPVEGPKQPYYISRADGKPLLMAGLWERWGKKGDESVETFAIVTTAANEFMSQVHDRMPAVLEPEAVERWLDPSASQQALQALLVPAADGVLQMHPVSTRVGNPRNQGAELAEPIRA